MPLDCGDAGLCPGLQCLVQDAVKVRKDEVDLMAWRLFCAKGALIASAPAPRASFCLSFTGPPFCARCRDRCLNWVILHETC
jgi:hypothetical protein